MDLMLGQRASVGWGVVATQNAPELAIVIPTLNERANISILVQRLASALNGISREAIFVDDDSADGTIDEVRRIAGHDARIRGIRRISRRGLAGAALEGILSTSAKQARHGRSPASRAQQWERCGTMSRAQPSPGLYREICCLPAQQSVHLRFFAFGRRH
jgi:hypothetical protein